MNLQRSIVKDSKPIDHEIYTRTSKPSCSLLRCRLPSVPRTFISLPQVLALHRPGEQTTHIPCNVPRLGTKRSFGSCTCDRDFSIRFRAPSETFQVSRIKDPAGSVFSEGNFHSRARTKRGREREDRRDPIVVNNYLYLARSLSLSFFFLFLSFFFFVESLKQQAILLRR